ncbi:MAG: hypothetical protein HQK50_12530 [Oligoflexia bacterium]|nr:hypothetical protein [Oligoflexia bacterium]MBF0366392.1 hypothetical protein [Oligoflexia bacterium]
MLTYSTQKDQLNLTLDISRLSEQQVRMIRAFNALVVELLSTSTEEGYFEKSSEVLRLWAMAVKNTNFSHQKHIDNINYSDQAIEYAIDSLMEFLNSPKSSSFDN